MTHTTHAGTASAAGVADYLLVVSNEDDYHGGFHHFAEKVNRKLKAGYQLHGPPFNINHTLVQAMVRPAGVAASGDTTMFFQSTAPRHD
jgi:hypothetical protein